MWKWREIIIFLLQSRNTIYGSAERDFLCVECQATPILRRNEFLFTFYGDELEGGNMLIFIEVLGIKIWFRWSWNIEK